MFPQTEEKLLETLKADDAALAATAEAMLWRTWCRSGNVEADRIFRAGVDAMQQGKLEEAAAEFSRVIEIVPEFAEGWNKRATVRFMRKDLRAPSATANKLWREIRITSGPHLGKDSATCRLASTARRPFAFAERWKFTPISMGCVTTWRWRKPKVGAADTSISRGLSSTFFTAAAL